MNNDLNVLTQRYQDTLSASSLKLRADKNKMLFFLEGLSKVESWGVEYLFWIMQNNKIFESIDKAYSVVGIRKILEVLPNYYRLLDSLLELLVRYKYIQLMQSGDYKAIYAQVIIFENIIFQKNMLAQNYPELKPNLDFLAKVLEGYFISIAGKQNFLNIMFPNGSFEVIEVIYKNNPDAAYYNKLTSLALSVYARELILQPHYQGKILEIGAGIGSTTAELLPELNANQLCSAYHYTDISKAFVQYGKRKLGQQFDFMSFDLLDIAKNPVSQGIELEAYDIVLATNVLHATSEILKTLEHVKSLLKPGGLLVLNEGIVRRDYATLVYGLTAGWWAFKDPEWRIPYSPFMALDVWKKLLQSSSFDHVHSMNSLINLDGLAHQDVIIARKG